jgi:hypothetical protein
MLFVAYDVISLVPLSIICKYIVTFTLNHIFSPKTHRHLKDFVSWVTKNLLSRAPPCFGRHVKPLVPVAFAIVITHSSFKEG